VAEATTGRSARVAILAPTGEDGPIAKRILSRWHIDVETYADLATFTEAIDDGVGVAILAEEGFAAPSIDGLLERLEKQPSWSDLPVIVLTAEGALAHGIAQRIEAIAARSNLTLLERPVRVATLVTLVRSALRARERQYDVRGHLQDLDAARAAAEQANRAKSDFLAMMSHELRTPLNAIGGYVDLLDLGIRGALNDEQRIDLARIQKSQRHLLSLINGLLTFARVERGSIEYRFGAVPLNELRATAESLVLPQATARGLTLTFEGCDETVCVRADREKLDQIVLNLLGNAIKFSERGGMITVRCVPDVETLAIIVEDTGCGIPSDRLAVIFEPFVQLDSRLTRQREGVGLGLAISRDLARGMGGDLTAESEVGVGSRFTLTLARA
jgi:signal transduction histidine kinase